MTKKIGIALASLAAVVLISAGGYALAGEKTCATSGNKKATTETTAKTGTQAAVNTTAPGCAATCATPCTAAGAAKAVNTESSATATPAVNTSAVTCTGAKDASGKPTCTAAEMAACKAAGIDCSAKHASKTASVQTASAGCAATCSSHASKTAACTPAEKAACQAAGKTCVGGMSKASYGANVYKVENGTMYAVADGKRFVVTSSTPYTQVGNARYYFADEKCAVGCQSKMSMMAPKYNAEAAKLTMRESNVKIIDGKKMAQCCSNEYFEVTESTPSLVMNGEKFYYCSQNCADHRMAMASN
ncbi:hypothetical protein KKC97_01765 [bacterium]|nr:hypothetical protein [bacterium]